MCGQRWLVHVLEQNPAMAQPVQRIWRLAGQFDSKAFLAAVRKVAAAHPALRTRLELDQGRWMQCFPDVLPQVEAQRIVGRTAADRAAYMRHVFSEDAARAFDLTAEPPLQLRVVDIDGELFACANLDHIAGDEIAFDLLEREIGLAYARECAGLPEQAPAASNELFYAFLRDQERFRASEKANLDWWRDRLAGSALDPKSDDEADWTPGATSSWTIDGDALAAISKACRTARVSVTAACLAAQARLRAEMRGTSDVVLNVPVSNRPAAQDRGLIANLSMLLHVRLRAPAAMDRHAFVQSVRDDLLEAMAHRHFDYGQLSQAVAEDAAARGGRLCWRWGFSAISERWPDPDGSGLFAERLDNKASPEAHLIPADSCVISMRQRTTGLAFVMDAPHDRDGAKLGTRYLELLAALLDVSDLSGVAVELH